MLAFVLIAAGGGWLFWRHRLAQKRLAAVRCRFFDDCLPAFENPKLTQQGIEFPRLVGRLRGLEVQLTPVIDTLSVRKLPSLWVLVTIIAPTPVPATIDLMMRPNGAEGFTNFHRLEHTVPTPRDWPAGLIIRTDDPQAFMPDGVLDAHAGFFSDPRAKELLISPKGIRLVWQAAEASRSHYGVYRQAHFEGAERFDAAVAGSMVERAIAIREAIVSHVARERSIGT